MSNVILKPRRLTKALKGFTAVNPVDLKLLTKHIPALICPNCAATRFRVVGIVFQEKKAPGSPPIIASLIMNICDE
ncbi:MULTISPECIES: hypothetical protein [Pseudomonas]|uniref:Transposase n=1 Tax=Pseudomonas petroselini TaxID=2899822 RepID=A0ABS8QPS9_9PSED|nr:MULTISPECIES: hypothetical protein [Pseudomonas]MCD7037674.1 hypothetical protein [Pseudomonas petroselini]MCD7046937.1 hypothetical protein [Pseudomonas petroselini]MCD7066517.1 hypothetical protein [Pseudomonas petroselini]MCD7080100.1 hypothetical protein [Pseudomonas petroselini]MCM2380436.1 hypothetical protein [Pseudomonas marginalis]